MNKTPAMILQELSMKECGRGPTYDLIDQQQGTHENLFEYNVEVLGINATGKGRSKKEAKQETAKKALLTLKERFKMDCVPSNLAQSTQQTPEDLELRKVVNYIGELDDACLRAELPCPEYFLILDSGPPHQKIFTYEGRLGHSIIERSTASTKKQARQNVAKQILERIDGIVPALVSEHNIEQLKLCDKDTEANEKYREINNTHKTNFNMKIIDYSNHLQTHLIEKNMTFDDIKDYFVESPTDEQLQKLVDKLELELEVLDLTEDESERPAVAYSLNTAVSACTLGAGSTVEEAKVSARKQLMDHIKCLTVQQQP